MNLLEVVPKKSKSYNFQVQANYRKQINFHTTQIIFI